MSIRIDNLTKIFHGHVLFDRLSLDIPLGRTTILAGRSGVGKTTLLRMVAGLDKDYSGDISGVPDTITFMFQEDRLLPWLSARDNIAFVLCDIMDNDKMDAVIDDMIDAVQLAGHAHKKPSKLSGGMKRRVAMARAYCYPAGLLLMDEPFKGLDAGLKNDMITLFKRLYVDTHKTAILVSHDETAISALDCHVIDLD